MNEPWITLQEVIMTMVNNDCSCLIAEECTCADECTCESCGCEECEGGIIGCACGGNCACGK